MPTMPLNQLIREGEEQYTFDSLGNPLHCAVNEYNQITLGTRLLSGI